MRKITYLEFCGKDKKSGLLGECIKIAVNEHWNRVQIAE